MDEEETDWQDDETQHAFYEGFFTRLSCGQCGTMIEVEGDVSHGEEVQCDVCDADLRVVGR